MAEPADDNMTTTSTGWMSDVQRALALIIIVSIGIAMLMATFRVVWSGEAAPDAVADMAKTLQAAMVNMGLIALGFFFGNTMAKMAQDAGQQKVVDKLTSTNPPTGGPVAPIPASTIIVAWWSLLTDPERKEIATSAGTDPDVAAFMAAAQTGAATTAQLSDLVTKGLLTQARADALSAA